MRIACIGGGPAGLYFAICAKLRNPGHEIVGERAKGGAGLVCTEMICVSPEGRITPGCAGLYAREHEAVWRRRLLRT